MDREAVSAAIPRFEDYTISGLESATITAIDNIVFRDDTNFIYNVFRMPMTVLGAATQAAGDMMVEEI